MQMIVNGEPVAPEWIEEEFAQIKAWHEQQSQVSCCERDEEFRAQAKDQVIGRLLLNQAAAREIPEPAEEDIRAAMLQLFEAHGGEEAFLQSMGLDASQQDLVRRQVILNLKVDRLVDRICEALEPLSDEALRSYHHQHASDFSTEARVRALHIFKSLRQAADKEALFLACCDVRERLVAGADFEQVAREFSDKPAEEIDLGFFKRGDLMDEFEYVAFSLRAGEISPVFSSYHGFHLAQVLEREPSRLRPFEEVEAEVRDACLQQRKSQLIQDHIQELRSKAIIEEVQDAVKSGEEDSV